MSYKEDEREHLEHDILTEQHAIYMEHRKARLRKQERIKDDMFFIMCFFILISAVSLLTVEILFILLSFGLTYMFYILYQHAAEKVRRIRNGEPESID